MLFPINWNAGTSKPDLKEKGCNGPNFAQIIWAEFKKVLHIQLYKCKKHCANGLKSENDSNYKS